MRLRIAVLFALVGGLLAAAVPAAAASAGTVQPAGGRFMAGPGVVTATRAAGGASTQSAASVCNIRVSQPQVNAALILTGTWYADCRSRANPSQPASDIAQLDMQVRIYQGDPTFIEPGTMVAGTRCLRAWYKLDCSTSTTSPIQYYIPYYSTLQIIVNYIDGTWSAANFHTYASRLT